MLGGVQFGVLTQVLLWESVRGCLRLEVRIFERLMAELFWGGGDAA